MNPKAIHPIIYVRGYAMTPEEIEDTVGDPYMGFNIGSAKLRQLWTGNVAKYFFESPVVRLMKQFRYADVFNEGLDPVSALPSSSLAAAPTPIPYRSIVIYRYYEPSSEDLGTGEKPDMVRFAKGLGQLIESIRSRMYPNKAATVLSPEEIAAGKPPYDQFRVYLVAHSMGGLVCRAFLQNPDYDPNGVSKLVDKVFTYATPHNGIEVGVLGNVPRWLSLYGIDTFNRKSIKSLLAIPDGVWDGDANDPNVDMLTNDVDAARVFNLVGTDTGDYNVAAGLSKAAVGNASDGLVRIKNATTRAPDGKGGWIQSPQAFVNRSHSGAYGIVNSEEGYQNLTRFLYGDYRADGYLIVDALTLPPAVQAKFDALRRVKASYVFEVTVSVRNKAWQLHRRTAAENSAIFRLYDDLFDFDKTTRISTPKPNSAIPLFNVFLDVDQSQDKDKPPGQKTVAFAADLTIRVPDYEVDGVLFFKDHFEGGYLFRDMVAMQATVPATPDGKWRLQYQFANAKAPFADAATVVGKPGLATYEIPVQQPVAPGISARLRIEAQAWNTWQ